MKNNKISFLGAIFDSGIYWGVIWHFGADLAFGGDDLFDFWLSAHHAPHLPLERVSGFSHPSKI